jgi:hypothetical protein
MSFIGSGKKRKVRRLCKACRRRTSIVKVNKSDGSKVARCNSCRAEYVLRRPFKGKKGSGFVILFLIFLVIVLAVSVFLFFAYRDSSSDDSFLNESLFPLKLKSVADSELNYYIYGVDGDLLQSGVISKGYIEVFYGEVNVSSYSVWSGGGDYYWDIVDCKLSSDKVVYCVLNPDRIGNPSMYVSNEELLVVVSDGVVQDSLICIAWGSPTLSVFITDLEREDIPSRLSHKVDICYFSGDLSESSRFSLDIRKYDRSVDNFTFYLIDFEFDDERVVRSYEFDTGLPDFVYVIEY